jgi:hypothetical protein
MRCPLAAKFALKRQQTPKSPWLSMTLQKMSQSMRDIVARFETQ